MEKEGILEPVKSSEWATPLVCVPKADGTVRLCGDYKVTVDPALHVDQHPILTLGQAFRALPNLWQVRGPPGNALDNAWFPVARTQTIILQVVYYKDSVFFSVFWRKKLARRGMVSIFFWEITCYDANSDFTLVHSLHMKERQQIIFVSHRQKGRCARPDHFPLHKAHGKEVSSNRIWVAYVCLSLCST